MNTAIAQLVNTHPSGLLAHLASFTPRKVARQRVILPPHHLRIIELRKKLPDGFDKNQAMQATGLGDRQVLEIMQHIVRERMAVRVASGGVKWVQP